MVSKNNILHSPNKKPILYDLFKTNDSNPHPLIIFSHGYKGFKDWGAWDLVAEEFKKNNINFLKYNFSHNGGTIENPIDFPDLEAFANNNYSLELDDLKRVLDMVTSDDFSRKHPFTDIILLGHSRGGGVSIIKAAEDDRVNKVATWASLSDFRPRFRENTPEFEIWEKTGITYVENARTKQQLPHYFQFYTDFIENQKRFSIQLAAENLNKKLLIIHGSGDTTVNIKEAQDLKKWGGANAELFLIPGADHVFGAAHPWKDSEITKELDTAIKKTIDFIKTV